MRVANCEPLRRTRMVPALLLVCAIGGPKIAAQTADDQSSGPARLTAEQDHQRLMDLLHVTSLRRGPNGDAKAPDAANVDESKVPPYTLPDPLVLKNGKRVTDARTWWKVRRPEIVEDFDREVFGREPKNTPKVKWEIIGTTREDKGGVAVINKNLLGHVDNTGYAKISVDIELS